MIGEIVKEKEAKTKQRRFNIKRRRNKIQRNILTCDC